MKTLSSPDYTLYVKIDQTEFARQIDRIENIFNHANTRMGFGGNSPSGGRGAGGIVGMVSSGLASMQNSTKAMGLFSKISDTIGSVAKNTLALVGISVGIASISALIVESSPILKSMFRLMNMGVMLLLRPIGDFIGMMLRPIIITLLTKFILPWSKSVQPFFDKLGEAAGQNLAKLLSNPASFFGFLGTVIVGALVPYLSKWGVPSGGTPGQTPQTVHIDDCIELCSQSRTILANSIGETTGRSLTDNLKGLLPLAVTATGVTAAIAIVATNIDKLRSEMADALTVVNTNLATIFSGLQAVYTGVVNLETRLTGKLGDIDKVLTDQLPSVNTNLGTVNTNLLSVITAIQTMPKPQTSMPNAPSATMPFIPSGQSLTQPNLLDAIAGGVKNMINGGSGIGSIPSIMPSISAPIIPAAAAAPVTKAFFDISSGAIISPTKSNVPSLSDLAASVGARFASGGVISEPIFGIGKSGQTYMFGEQGSEVVSKSGGFSIPRGGGNTLVFYVTINNGGDINKLKSLVMQWTQQTNSRGSRI